MPRIKSSNTNLAEKTKSPDPTLATSNPISLKNKPVLFLPNQTICLKCGVSNLLWYVQCNGSIMTCCAKALDDDLDFEKWCKCWSDNRSTSSISWSNSTRRAGYRYSLNQNKWWANCEKQECCEQKHNVKLQASTPENLLIACGVAARKRMNNDKEILEGEISQQFDCPHPPGKVAKYLIVPGCKR